MLRRLQLSGILKAPTSALTLSVRGRIIDWLKENDPTCIRIPTTEDVSKERVLFVAVWQKKEALDVLSVLSERRLAGQSHVKKRLKPTVVGFDFGKASLGICAISHDELLMLDSLLIDPEYAQTSDFRTRRRFERNTLVDRDNR